MIYLTDTHTLIWSILEPLKLSNKSRSILEDNENTIYVSAINFWEISLKYSIGKLNLEGVLPHEFPSLAIKTGFELISITPEEASTYHLLIGDWHKDPFDKMLIWQAIKNDWTLISIDENVAKYREIGLMVVW